MAAATDLLLDANGDLPIDTGLQLGASDGQHIRDCINAFAGWWKQNWTVGVGIRAFVNSSGQEQVIEQRIRLQLTADGYSVQNPRVIMVGGQFTQIYPNAIRP